MLGGGGHGTGTAHRSLGEQRDFYSRVGLPRSVPRPLPGIVLALALLAAGCVAAPAPEPAAPAPAAGLAFHVASGSCAEGGGYVTWNMEDDRDVPAPFEGADVRDDLGNPPFNGGTGSPVPRGNMTGAYHATIHCPDYTLDGVAKKDLHLAFVGGRVQPPPFNPDGVTRHYALTAIGASDPDIHAAWEALGLPMDPLLSASLSFDRDVLVGTMSFAIHGDIVSVVPVKTYREKPDETIRLWFRVPREDGSMGLYALDMRDEGGTHLVASSVGHFDHRAPSPAPPAPGPPLHEFPSWALAYRDVVRTLAPGPVVDVVLDADGHAH